VDADPDPTFYLSADPDPGSQPNADPDLDHGQTLKSQKVEILPEKYTVLLSVGNRSKNINTKYEGTKAFSKPGLFVANFGQFHAPGHHDV
jgi:hypothetical protein